MCEKRLYYGLEGLGRLLVIKLKKLSFGSKVSNSISHFRKTHWPWLSTLKSAKC